MGYKWAVLLSIIPGLTMVMLDYTIVNVALAKLGAVFDVNVATVGWTVTGFALATGIVTPLGVVHRAALHDEARVGRIARPIHHGIAAVWTVAGVLGAGRRTAAAGHRRRSFVPHRHERAAQRFSGGRARSGDGTVDRSGRGRPRLRSDHWRLHHHPPGLALGVPGQLARRRRRRGSPG